MLYLPVIVHIMCMYFETYSMYEIPDMSTKISINYTVGLTQAHPNHVHVQIMSTTPLFENLCYS